jgi:hypothetical protein
MATEPVATDAAIPLVPGLVLIVAIVGSLDAQLTSPEMTWVVESLNCPVAAKVICVPGAIEEMDGVTDIETMVALVTFTFTDAVCAPGSGRVAVIEAKPRLTPCTFPFPFD